MSIWLIFLLGALVGTGTAQTPDCQLTSGDCVCGDPNIHNYCTTTTCAPEDFSDRCLTVVRHTTARIFPDEWELMFDSYDYLNLLGASAVWLTRQFDGDSSSDQWVQRGSICHMEIRACSYPAGPQDNWVFTQHIKYPPGSVAGYPTEIYLNIKVRFTQCTQNPACINDYATLYRYDTNGLASQTARTIPANYLSTPFFGPGTEATTSRLQQTGSGDYSVTRTHIINSPPSSRHRGFYLGIRDTGTCGQVRRILLYYTPCKKLQDGLVKYPELVRPPEGSSPNTAEACCAPNSHNTTSLTIRAYSASDGRCERNVVCECDAGYRLDDAGTSCEICQAGTYRSLADPQVRCITCPLNTVKSVAGASECACLDGYFRDEQTNEGPESDCTPPPSPVRNLRAIVIKDTSVTVQWTRPAVTGGDSFYYTIEYSNPDNTGSFLPADPGNDRYVNPSLTVTYTFPRGNGLPLHPNTPYTIRVITHNKVSDQDSPNAACREIDVQVRTMEGAPSPPQDVRSFPGVVVWGPPAEPNGVIIGYRVRFSGSSSSRDIFKAPSKMYHVVSNSDISNLGDNFQVQVNARTSVGYGEFSSPQSYTEVTTSCPPPSPCPTMSPHPTCPPVPAVRFMLRNRTYHDNDVVLFTDIGEGDDALLCVTDNANCCRPPSEGEFYYPDGTTVGWSATNPLYRNRGSQVVRLNKRGNVLSPLGRYRCDIPDSRGVTQSIHINIWESAEEPSCPPTEPSPTFPPTVTCPPTSLPSTCPEPQQCPTCPTTTPCPMCTPCPTTLPEPAVKFMVGGKTYLDEETVLITDIGEAEIDALLCVTDKPGCCSDSNIGEFYYPNGTTVGFSSTNSLYRTRDTQVVRLNRRDNPLSPLGRYRCDIPDSRGVTQSIYINIALAMDLIPPVCPPPSTSPTCPPSVTCPACPPQITCSTCPTPTTCPTITCPTCPSTRPTCQPCPTCAPDQGTHPKFMLRGQSYLNNTVVLITDIGEDRDALLCVTDKPDCCRMFQEGEFYYPDGTAIGWSATNSLFRNRGSQVVRLNRRNNVLSPLGSYRCDIPDSRGVTQSIYISILAAAEESTCPPTETPSTCPTVTCPTCPPTILPTTIPPPEPSVLCSELSAPENGNVEYSERKVNSIARYSCNRGYTLSGTETRQCDSTGQWSRKEPICYEMKQQECQLKSGDCVCGDPSVHSYCNSSTCAPDDSSCTMNDLPEEWVVLFDSYSYQSLIYNLSPVWVTQDVDEDGLEWLQKGESCENVLITCNFVQQNNWIFSQHIKYPLGSVTVGETEVYLNISYRFVSMLDHTSLYRYDTNELASTSNHVNTHNYKPFFGPGTEATTSRLRQVGGADTTIMRSFNTQGKMGFYLGIRDTGSCGQVRRILLYYTPCKKLQDGLVNYPELVRPPEGSPPNLAEACCAPNSHNTTSLTIRAYSASDGRCERNVVCDCDAGYRLDNAGTGCTAVRFMLHSKTYFNYDDIVLITDIGVGGDALLCVTDQQGCCSSSSGEFFYPNGTAVGFSSTNSLYQNRGSQVVRLNKRDNALSPLGRYRCDIPDSRGVTQSIYINVASAMDPPTCRVPTR